MKISYTLASCILITLLFIFRILYIIGGFYALAPDETYFWEWSRHLDWSYYDMGPMVAYIIALTTKIFGATELGVRIGAVILSAGVSIVIYYLASEMFGSSKIGFSAVVLMNIVPIGATGFYHNDLLLPADLPLGFVHLLPAQGNTPARQDGGIRWAYPLGSAS
jgi:4-amino-4-deoxy-L-arabinose transferase-like glycosyltransferase